MNYFASDLDLSRERAAVGGGHHSTVYVSCFRPHV